MVKLSRNKAGEVISMKVTFQVFRGTWASWQDLFTEAAAFASTLPPERLISISHSEDKDDGVVTVWYWSDGSEGTIG